MARLMATNKSNTPDVDPGVYEAIITAVEEAEGGDPKYDKGYPREVITYQVKGLMDDDGKPLTLKQWVTVYTDGQRPASVLYGTLAAVLYGGEVIPEGEDIDTDDLVGKPCRIQWGKKDRGEGMGITAVYPAKKAAATAGRGRTVTQADIDAI